MSAPQDWSGLVEAATEAMVDPATFPDSDMPDWITLSPISDLAYRVFGIIKAHQSKDQPRPFPGQEKLAKMLGYAKTDPIRDAVQELRDIGAVTTTFRPSANGRRMHYQLHDFPAVNAASYVGPRKTSDLYRPGVLEAMGEARARRKRGVPRNPSGVAKAATRRSTRRSASGTTLTKVDPQ